MITIYSTDSDVVKHFKSCITVDSIEVIENLYELEEMISDGSENIIIADYDSVAHEINQLLQSDKIAKNMVILESSPIVAIGKSLIRRGIKAYGNSMMRDVHIQQIIDSIKMGRVWMYPELGSAIIKDSMIKESSEESELYERVTSKEKAVIHLVLKGLNNKAISEKLYISERTVKAHLTSIFSKLHVNDRLSLVLLFK
ncbi:MAG: LuxR C-terminal-related transcriptional regulator [Campylobacterota bacterium]|nr:LuxR C-terminal-related transcriptional regulator [Campylobacterota bacterium]